MMINPDEKILRDLSTLSDQVSLCQSMLAASYSSSSTSSFAGGDAALSYATDDEALLTVIGYLEACVPRMVELIEAAAQGALSASTFEECLVANDRLTNVLADVEAGGGGGGGRSDDDATTERPTLRGGGRRPTAAPPSPHPRRRRRTIRRPPARSPRPTASSSPSRRSPPPSSSFRPLPLLPLPSSSSPSSRLASSCSPSGSPPIRGEGPEPSSACPFCSGGAPPPSSPPSSAISDAGRLRPRVLPPPSGAPHRSPRPPTGWGAARP